MEEFNAIYSYAEQLLSNIMSWKHINTAFVLTTIGVALFLSAMVCMWRTGVGRLMRWVSFLLSSLLPLALLEVVFAGTPVLLGWLLKLTGATESGGGPIRGWFILILVILFAWYVLYMIFSKAVINWLFRPISAVAPSAETASKIFVREFWFARAVVLVGLSWFLIQDSTTEASSFAALIAIVVIAIATWMMISAVNEGFNELSLTMSMAKNNRNKTDDAIEQADSISFDDSVEQSPA